MAREHLVEGHAERVDVGPVVEGDPPRHGLLGAHVEHRSYEIAAQGEALLTLEAREAEVENAKSSAGASVRPVRRFKDEIRGLHVSVNDALRVGMAAFLLRPR